MTLNNSDKNQFCPLPTTATSPNKQHTKPNTITAEHISMQPGSHPGWLSSDCQIVSLLLLCKIFLETAHVDVAFSNPQWCCTSYGQKYCISEEKEKLHWPLPEAAPLTAIWEVRRSAQCWTWRNCIPPAQKITTHSELDHKNVMHQQDDNTQEHRNM